MDVSTSAIILVAIIFIYFVLYKKNRLLGNIGFMSLGFGIMSDAADNTVTTAIGLIMLAGGFINAVYDVWITIEHKKHAKYKFKS